MKVLLFALFLFVSSIRIRKPFLSSYEFASAEEKFRYTKSQLTPQFSEDDNPFENSGYFKVNEEFGGYLFYLFFYAQSTNASNVPLLIWLNGGPGCSSMGGAFTEMGPYRLDRETLKLVKHDKSWNTKYHMLFIDQPVGSGYSYVEDKAGYVTDQIEIQDQMYSLLEQFYSKYPDMLKSDLYIFGESYAGKYVPSIAHKIQIEGFKFPLKGIGIGDGLTHPEVQFGTYHDLALTTQMIDVNDYEYIMDLQNKSIDAIRQEDWKAASDNWETLCDLLSEKSGDVNVYDIRTHTPYDFTHLSKYMNMESTKKLMHTQGHKFDFCNPDVYTILQPDMPKSVQDYVIKLLDESDVRVMIYAGQFDLIVPTTSTVYGFAHLMPWKGMKGFQQAERNIWKVNGQWAGWAKTYGNLWGVIVGNGGHMVPMDQPDNTLDMVDRLIAGKWE